MVAARTAKQAPPDLGHVRHLDVAGETIWTGGAITVDGWGLVKFQWVDRLGNVTFSDKDGAFRTVHPDRVQAPRRKRGAPKLRPGRLPVDEAKAKAVADPEYASMTPGQKAAYTKRMRMAS